MNEIPISDLKEIVWYEPQSGKLFWKLRPLKYFAVHSFSKKFDHSCNAWNARYAGTLIKRKNSNGYVVLSALGVRIPAHRAVWALHNEKWPSGEIDHINQNKLDNRIENLRDVSHSINLRNVGIRANNKSGMTGVIFDNSRNKFKAFIAINGRTITLGRYLTFGDAAQARSDYELACNYSGLSVERVK